MEDCGKLCAVQMWGKVSVSEIVSQKLFWGTLCYHLCTMGSSGTVLLQREHH